MQRWGLLLILIGVLSFALPIIGIQFSLISLLGGGSQALAGLGAIGLGAILLVLGTIKERGFSRRGATTSVTTDSGSRCSSCGASLDSTQSFCRQCGTPVEDASASPPVQEAGAEVTDLRCVCCGTVAVPGQRFCSQCGRLIRAKARETLLRQTEVPSAERRCSSCGTLADAGQQYCAECGTSLGVPSGRVPRRAAPRRSKRAFLIFAGFAMLALALLWLSRSAILSRLRPRPTVTRSGGDLLGGETGTPLAEMTSVPGGGQTRIDTAWLEHNVLLEDKYWLAVHADFQVSQAEADDIWAVARFWRIDGTPMPSEMVDYDWDGQAAVWEWAEVPFAPNSYWEGYTLYIPYEALETGSDHYATFEIVDVETESVLIWFDTEDFSVNR